MVSCKGPLLVLGASLAAPVTSHADAIAVPVPPALSETVPASLTVVAAVSQLRGACSAWQSTGPFTGDATAATGKPRVPAEDPPERALCDHALHPNRSLLAVMIGSAAAGAVLFFLALALFCGMRAILVSLWNWRLPMGRVSSW